MVRKLDDKFYGTKPLKRTIPESYPDKFLIQYHQFEEPKEFDLWDAIRGNRLPEDGKIVFGIKRPPEEFTKYDFLICLDGPAFVAHKRVIDKLNELCPEDFQALPIEIKNLDNKFGTFVNHDYYLINILALVDAIDKEKTIIEYSANGTPWIYNLTFKEDPMGDHLLARDRFDVVTILFHPALARELVKCKGIRFYSDIEDYSWTYGKGRSK